MEQHKQNKNGPARTTVQSGGCPYCGDAFVNHSLLYASNTISMLVDPFVYWSVKHSPKFIKSFVDFILRFIFRLLVLFRLANFSEDIEKSASLRSKIIWEEASKRGLHIHQFIVYGRPTEHYRVKINGKFYFYESLPVPPRFVDTTSEDWDNKFTLKKHFKKQHIPVPKYYKVPNSKRKAQELFEKLEKPVIVKPAIGSRARHTTTNIFTLAEFEKAVRIGHMITPTLVVEEHLQGFVCRATLVNNKLAGFYRGESPAIVGDGTKTIGELIKAKDETRPERVSAVPITKEIEEYILRLGFDMQSILPKDKKIYLTHRTGRYFGGRTKEMFALLHPSFVPILEKAARTTNLAVVGFDCIVPDPEKDAGVQRWGIIECNTLPFIDLHYFALEGKPQNITGMIWDLWDL